MQSVGLTRRNLVRGSVWTAPVVAVGFPAPASAASCLAKVSISPTGLSGAGFDLYLRDSLNINANVALMTLTATDLAGLPIIGASVSVFGDEQKDGEGNYMIGFSPTSQTSGFGESPSKRVTAGTTSASGALSVKVSTATYGVVDCGQIPKTGVFTVVVTTACGAVPTVFTYQIWDGPTAVSCP